MEADSFPLDALPQILHAEYEEHRDDRYFFNNAQRKTDGILIIQRTLEGAAWIEDATGRHRVGPGQAMLFAHGEKSLYGIGDPEDRPYRLEYVALKGSPDIRRLFFQLKKDHAGVIAMNPEGQASGILHNLVSLLAENRSLDQLEMAELAYQLILALLREQVAGSQARDPVSYLRLLLQTRFRSHRNLKEWMAELPYSREHLTREFTRRFGEGPAEYLRKLRLEHARLLARTSHMPVEEMAVSSGFASAQTFRRAYRRQFGHSVGIDRSFGGHIKTGHAVRPRD